MKAKHCELSVRKKLIKAGNDVSYVEDHAGELLTRWNEKDTDTTMDDYAVICRSWLKELDCSSEMTF